MDNTLNVKKIIPLKYNGEVVAWYEINPIERASFPQKIISMVHHILLKAAETGKMIQDEPELIYTIEVIGEPRNLFALLAMTMAKYPEFKRLAELAIKHVNTHDKENCPYCNPAKQN